MDKIIVVGASGAIGKAIAEKFENNGSEVVRTSSSKKNGYSFLNLRDRISIEAFSTEIDYLQHLVVAAGKEPQQSLRELNEEHLLEMIDLHFAGPLWLIKCLCDKFTPDSTITLISSIASTKGSYDPVYASVKGAVNSLVRTLARELAPVTRVNAIAPGLVKDTPVYQRMTEDFCERHLSNTLTKRLLSASEIAEMVQVFGNQKNLNGQIIHLNGGQYFGQ